MKQLYNIPTYDEAKEIVSQAGDLIFYENVQTIDGYKISTFNYRLANYNHFIEYNGFEMRGICFVFNLDGSLFKRYILMNKFFNLNQVEETQYHLIKDIPIVSNHDKADGSVITFVRLPNGKVLAKSKMIVGENTQALMAQEIYESNTAIKNLVNYTLDNDIVAIFELVSPKNRVVVKYNKTDLILLRLRDNITGQYLNLDVVSDYTPGVTIVEPLPYMTWDEIIPLMETMVDKEGGVVQLENDQLIKWKTKWYVDLHNLFTDYVNREDYLICMTLDEKIDDILGQLSDDDAETRLLVNIVIDRVHTYLTHTTKEVKLLVDEFYNVFNKDRREFVKKYLKTPYFSFAILVIEGKDVFEVICSDLKKKTYHLQKARYFIETGKV